MHDHDIHQGTPVSEGDGLSRRGMLLGAAGLAAVGTAGVMLGGAGSVAAADGGATLRFSVPELGSSTVLAWSWGASNSGSLHGGGGTGRAAFQDISITQPVGTTSPLLLDRLARGLVIPSAVLTDGRKKDVMLSITMSDVLVSSLSLGGSSGDDLTENVTLHFAEYRYEVNSVSSAWDIAENQPPAP